MIQYIRDLGIENTIIIISNKVHIQIYLDCGKSINFLKKWEGNILIKKVNVLKITNKFNNYLPLITRYVPNDEYNEVFNTTLNKIINSNLIKYALNSTLKIMINTRKFLILENRIRINNKKRGFEMNDFVEIRKFCIDYCNYNNLNFLLWDDVQTNRTIYEQQIICNNAEIIISIGGSFNLFNVGHKCSKIIILEVYPECLHETILINCLNIFCDHCSNNTKVYFYIPFFINSSAASQSYIYIIKNIFNNNIDMYKCNNKLL